MTQWEWTETEFEDPYGPMPETPTPTEMAERAAALAGATRWDTEDVDMPCADLILCDACGLPLGKPYHRPKSLGDSQRVWTCLVKRRDEAAEALVTERKVGG